MNVNRSLLRLIFSLLIGLMIMPAPTVLAKTGDSDKAIQIEADSVLMNEKEGISHYKGNVKIIQGSRQILGNQISIYSKNKKVVKVVINGKPALFSQLNDNNEYTKASSLKMIFYTDKDLLVMQQQAELRQKENVFRSDKISYNTAKDIITAGPEKKNGQERVKITLHPDKNKK